MLFGGTEYYKNFQNIQYNALYVFSNAFRKAIEDHQQSLSSYYNNLNAYTGNYQYEFVQGLFSTFLMYGFGNGNKAAIKASAMHH